MLKDLLRRFDAALRESTTASARSMVVAAGVGAAVFTGYGILWLHVTPVEHESLGLRAIAVLLCLAVFLSPHWPRRLQPLLPWVWFAGVMYTLPFYATYQLLGSNYSVLRSMLEVTMVFFVIVVFPHYLLALANIALGIGLGVLAGWLTIPGFGALNHAIVKSVHIQALVYTATAGLLFMRSNLAGMLARQRIDTLKDLAGSIAHELRNPLGQLRQRLETVNRRLPRPAADRPGASLSADDLNALHEELAEGRFAIERGLQMIAMTLDEIHAKPLDNSSLRYLSAECTTRKALDRFGYDSADHRARVELHVAQDFVFKVDETRYVFVLFNLLKNALYYFASHPQARVRVVVDRHCVTFEDTGPGMKPEVLARAFESFHTSGKAGGTGLGLSFCRRTMQAFGGDIGCESELGRFTRFSLYFPAVPAAEIAAHEAQVLERARLAFAGKRVLVVDDVPALRETTRALLAPLDVQIEEAGNGQQALERLARSPVDAIVLDLAMPVLDGYGTAESIRSGRIPGLARVPIVALTAEPAAVALAKLERVAVDAVVGKPCSQVQLLEALCRAHEHAREADERDRAAAGLAGKTILVADDDAFSRRYLRVLLEQHGIEVAEAEDGAAALRRLQAAPVDAVVTDLHMPALDGIGLAQAVRDSDLARKPVLIALSARDDAAAVEKARAAGISDFVSKPAQPGDLLAKLARHLGAGSRAAVSAAAGRPPVPDLREEQLLNASRLESLRRVGMLEDDVPQAIQASRILIDELQEPLAQQDFEATRELLHSLVGICGNAGLHKLHQETRSLYAQLVENRQWPGPGWHDKLVHLHARTQQAFRAGYRPAAEQLSG
ncbi:response regulator [Ramlibacter tataouinensis]|uniref:ATP-binding response regulator n=1 Tax=Ramlibacter tataouinensis TaxID=94132 RepID=UPI0022F3A586|nr:response regulator [Ramlibacter tataouinensis]WBY02497.1 response regulator [Ramlibacter tataouinensis]